MAYQLNILDLKNVAIYGVHQGFKGIPYRNYYLRGQVSRWPSI